MKVEELYNRYLDFPIDDKHAFYPLKEAFQLSLISSSPTAILESNRCGIFIGLERSYLVSSIL